MRQIFIFPGTSNAGGAGCVVIPPQQWPYALYSVWCAPSTPLDGYVVIRALTGDTESADFVWESFALLDSSTYYSTVTFSRGGDPTRYFGFGGVGGSMGVAWLPDDCIVTPDMHLRCESSAPTAIPRFVAQIEWLT